MPKKFDDIEVGQQLELPAHQGAKIYYELRNDGKDPNRTIRVAIVTHIWYDPVDDKEYVGLAYLRHNGSYGKPTEKRTITGLARCGWRKATKDWLELLAATKAGEVIRLWGRPRA